MIGSGDIREGVVHRLRVIQGGAEDPTLTPEEREHALRRIRAMTHAPRSASTIVAGGFRPKDGRVYP